MEVAEAASSKRRGLHQVFSASHQFCGRAALPVMKRAFASLGGLLLWLSPTHADYVIVQKVEGGMQTGTMTVKIKDTKVRTDVAPQMSTITDGATGDVITLMHTPKTYMKIPAAQAHALLEQTQKLQASKQAAGGAAPKLTPSGRKEKVGVHECEIYTWTGNGINLTYWFAKEFPNQTNVLGALVKMQNSGLAAIAKALMPDMSQFPGMPMKTEMTVGPQKTTTTLVSVSEENVDPTAFEVPSDYKETATPAFNFPAAPAAK